MAVAGTPVAAENAPVTTDEMKDWSRIDIADDDAMVAALLLAATAHVELVTGRTLLTATKYHYLTDWEYPIELPEFPLASVTTIKYIDPDGVEQELAPALYDVDIAEEPGFVRLGYGDTWPTLRGDENGITITYVVGYGAAADVPEGLKGALKALTAHWYEHREAVAEGTFKEVPLAVEMLLWNFRVTEAG